MQIFSNVNILYNVSPLIKKEIALKSCLSKAKDLVVKNLKQEAIIIVNSSYHSKKDTWHCSLQWCDRSLLPPVFKRFSSLFWVSRKDITKCFIYVILNVAIIRQSCSSLSLCPLIVLISFFSKNLNLNLQVTHVSELPCKASVKGKMGVLWELYREWASALRIG